MVVDLTLAGLPLKQIAAQFRLATMTVSMYRARPTRNFGYKYS
jgi:DNA-binding CsgD family transcriptional regulator